MLFMISALFTMFLTMLDISAIIKSFLMMFLAVVVLSYVTSIMPVERTYRVLARSRFMNTFIALTILKTVSSVVVTVRTIVASDDASVVLTDTVGIATADSFIACTSTIVTTESLNISTLKALTNAFTTKTTSEPIFTTTFGRTETRLKSTFTSLASKFVKPSSR